MDKVFEKAIATVIRNQVTQNNVVTIDGLGSFRLENIRQKPSRSRDGKSVLTPPRDIIVFTPEKEAT
jgi:nucleoid DNA-binding protein